MQPFGTRLKDHFQRELTALRQDAGVFAQSYPAEAEALRLGHAGSADPHVNMLMQSFAFLAGRVRYEMEVVKASLPNALLNQLHPHLSAPLPCMMVAQLEVKPDVPPGAVLARGRQLIARAVDDQGRRLDCRMRSTCELPLVALKVTGAELSAAAPMGGASTARGLESLLRVVIRRTTQVPVEAMQLKRLRFYIDAQRKHAHYLFEMLTRHFDGASLRPLPDSAGRAGAARVLDGCRLHWCGMQDDEAALPARRDAHPGHRLLQEYFAFPEKFMFFELGPLDLSGVVGDFELHLRLRAPIDGERDLDHDLLKLNCVPLVNLYPQRIDPLTLDQTRFEYWLRADVQGHAHCEVHSLEELVAIQSDGSLRQLRPYFEMEDLVTQEHQDQFYVLRHEQSQLGNVAGTEAYLSFVDADPREPLPGPAVIAGRALCTNRRLPERMRAGQALHLEGPGPVTAATLLSPPTPHTTPALTGQRPWALASQMSLNHLSLANGAHALAAFKRVLMAHLGPAGMPGVRHIDGLHQISCRPTVRHRLVAGQRGFEHGLAIVLTFDRSRYEDGSALLFASVLRHFLVLYAAVNTVIEVSYQPMDRKGSVFTWPPMVGAQNLL